MKGGKKGRKKTKYYMRTREGQEEMEMVSFIRGVSGPEGESEGEASCLREREMKVAKKDREMMRFNMSGPGHVMEESTWLCS